MTPAVLLVVVDVLLRCMGRKKLVSELNIYFKTSAPSLSHEYIYNELFLCVRGYHRVRDCLVLVDFVRSLTLLPSDTCREWEQSREIRLRLFIVRDSRSWQFWDFLFLYYCLILSFLWKDIARKIGHWAGFFFKDGVESEICKSHNFSSYLLYCVKRSPQLIVNCLGM